MVFTVVALSILVLFGVNALVDVKNMRFKKVLNITVVCLCMASQCLLWVQWANGVSKGFFVVYIEV